MDEEGRGGGGRESVSILLLFFSERRSTGKKLSTNLILYIQFHQLIVLFTESIYHATT